MKAAAENLTPVTLELGPTGRDAEGRLLAGGTVEQIEAPLKRLDLLDMGAGLALRILPTPGLGHVHQIAVVMSNLRITHARLESLVSW